MFREKLCDVLRFPKQLAGEGRLNFQPGVIDSFSQIRGLHDGSIEHEINLRFRNEGGGGNDNPWSRRGGQGHGQERQCGAMGSFHKVGDVNQSPSYTNSDVWKFNLSGNPIKFRESVPGLRCFKKSARVWTWPEFRLCFPAGLPSAWLSRFWADVPLNTRWSVTRMARAQLRLTLSDIGSGFQKQPSRMW